MARADATAPKMSSKTGSDEGTGASLRSQDTAERERAWRLLYEQNFDRVYRLVCRFGVEPGDAEELTQRAFVIAFRRMSEHEEIRAPAAWLRGIVVRVVSQHRRWRRVREAKRWFVRDLRVAAPQPVPTPERNAAAAEELDNIRAVLRMLSPKLRDVLVLCDIEECTAKEAAELLRVPVNTVRSRRRAARERFTRLWRDKYGGDR